MKLVCVADLHGVVYPQIPPCDVLIVAGDYEAGYIDKKEEARFLAERLQPWLNSAPAKHIIATPGNHDGLTEALPDFMKKLDWHLLIDEGVTIDGVKFWGSPWTPTFFNWHFMKDDPDLKPVWDLIPEDVDVLITHGPPYGILDTTNRTKKSVGSTTLRRRLLQLDALKLHVFGHIHEAYGMTMTNDDRTLCVNASQVNAVLLPTNGPRTVYL